MEHLNFAQAPENWLKSQLIVIKTRTIIVIIWPILLSRKYAKSFAIILKPAFRALVIDGLHNERFASH